MAKYQTVEGHHDDPSHEIMRVYFTFVVTMIIGEFGGDSMLAKEIANHFFRGISWNK